MCSNLWADEVVFELDHGWQFYQSSSVDLHYSQIEPTDWQPVSPPNLLQTNAKNGIYGWYRIKFDWDKPEQENLSLYLQSIRHGDETWLNGQKIGATGYILTPWDFSHTNPQNLPRKYRIPSKLLKPLDNVLAIKVNLGLGETWGAMYPGGVGIGGDLIAIGTNDVITPIYIREILQSAVIDTVLVILGLVDLFIIVFLFRTSFHHFDEFWWLLLSSCFMMMGSLLLDHFYILKLEELHGINLLLVLSLLSAPFTTAMYFWSIHKNIATKLLYPFIGVWLFLILLILIPGISDQIKNPAWLIWEFLAGLFLIYALYSAVQGVLKSYPSSVIQLFGLIIFIISIRTQWLPDDLWEHRNIIVGTLIFRYALLYSYFRRIHCMSQDYKKLSENMLNTIEEHKQEVARDLHDDLGQHLTAAKLRLLLCDQKNKEGSVAFIKQEIDASIQSCREIMASLHPIVLEKFPFKEALQKEAERLSNLYAVSIDLNVTEIELNKSLQKHLLRIFQETIFNAIHHGKASHIKVELLQASCSLHYEISDDGQGFQNSENSEKKVNNGFGLISLKERVALMDGKLTFTSSKHSGVCARIDLPL